MARKTGSGAARKTTPSDDRLIKRMSLNDRFLTAVDVRAAFLGYGGNDIGVHTIRRRLCEAGLMARRSAKKPLRNWAKKYSNWTPRDWQRVIFSDESKFNLFGSDGIQYVRRRKGERVKENCLLRNVKHPGGQMIWGCFSYHGLGELAFVKGTVNSETYKKNTNQPLITIP